VKITVSDSDKKLLLMLGMVLMVVCAYFFGYTKLVDMTDKAEADKTSYEKVYRDLLPQYQNKKRLISNTEKYKALNEKLLSSYTNGTTQESAIVFINAIEKEFSVWFSQVGISETTKIYSFGNITSTNPNKSGQSVYSSDLTGHKTTLTLNYEAGYENWKNLIKALNEYKYKCTIDSISSSYDIAGDKVTGNMTLSIYDITGGDRKLDDISIKSIPVGTGNIYNSTLFVPGTETDSADGGNIINDHDLFMVLNSSTSDLDTVIIGQQNDVSEKKSVSELKNEVVKAYIVITGEAGVYKVGYKVGNTTYPEKDYISGEELSVGESLDMAVISSIRNSDKDMSGVELTVDNKSDIALNIKIVNDDNEKPRFSLKESTGKVNLY
jgi:hypothetical protein